MRKYIIIIWVLISTTIMILAYARFYQTTTTYTSLMSISSIPTLRALSTSEAISRIQPIPVTIPKITVAPTEPVISADEYLVGNAATGKIYISHNIHYATPIASISKLFTTHVVDATMNMDQVVTITQPMLDVYPDSYGINLGEEFTVGELIYPLLLQSNNNLAEGLAMTYGYDSFIKKLNDFASSLAMSHTHFVDASGLDAGNISTASDLFTFAQYLYTTDPAILTITRTQQVNLATTTTHGSHIFINIDPFVGDPHLIGGKTGRTAAAGETMLSIFNMQVNNKNYPIVIIVLHSDQGTRALDTEKLLFQAEKIIAATKK